MAASDTATVTAECDCIVAVAAEEDPVDVAASVDTNADAPVVVYGDVDETRLPSVLDHATDVVRRQGPESHVLLGRRVQTVAQAETTVAADGGQTAETEEVPIEWTRRRLHEVVSSSEHSPMEKIAEMLAIGCERLSVDSGFLTAIEDGIQEIVESVGDHPHLQPGSTTPLERAYCRKTLGRETPLAVDDAKAEG